MGDIHDILLAIAKDSPWAIILCGVLYGCYRLVSEIKTHISEGNKLLRSLHTLLVLHDMTASGINPNSDINSSDPEVRKITQEKVKKILEVLEELKHETRK
ncbi:MAG: hypothetical protein KatS3mg087_1119 [Patescibacteria group bacterium]|nr:MAG: hypothetical protein KatS3mg087_1119 [Patescibacteria group bacterium]